MKTITYTCDICGKKINKGSGTYHRGVITITYPENSNGDERTYDAHDDCIDELFKQAARRQKGQR